MASTDLTGPVAFLDRLQAPWPAHPKPHADETMTSWLLRIAEANGIPFQSLCGETWKGRKVQQTCLDRCPSDLIVEALGRRVGRTADEVRATTLGSLEGRLYQGPLEGRTQWVLPSSEGKRSAGHQQFCPECLAEDVKPHFRLGGQLAFVTVCPHHGNRPLLDACPFCHRPLDLAHNHAPKRRNQPDHPITVCRHCAGDLREAVGVGMDPERFFPGSVDRRGQTLQARMLVGLKEGWMIVLDRLRSAASRAASNAYMAASGCSLESPIRTVTMPCSNAFRAVGSSGASWIAIARAFARDIAPSRWSIGGMGMLWGSVCRRSRSNSAGLISGFWNTDSRAAALATVLTVEVVRCLEWRGDMAPS